MPGEEGRREMKRGGEGRKGEERERREEGGRGEGWGDME